MSVRLALVLPTSSSINIPTAWNNPGPGSHQLLYRGLSDEVNFVPNEQYASMLETAKSEIAPVEFLGGVGDVPNPPNLVLGSKFTG